MGIFVSGHSVTKYANWFVNQATESENTYLAVMKKSIA